MSSRYPKRLLVLWLALALVLTACRRGTPTPDEAATLTANAPATPTSAPQITIAVASATPTVSPAAPTATEAAAGETPASATPDPNATATLTPQPGVDQAEFIADVTVPDGADYTPGEAFVKTWRLRNAGGTTWTTEYALVFVRGEQMGGPGIVPLASPVAPGETVDISVDMTAPANLGTHTGFWQLRSAAGALFGLGPEANQPVYVQIDVVAGGGASPVPPTQAATAGTAATAATGQPAATATTGAPPAALRVTGATLSLDQAEVTTAACPHTFQVTATFTSEGAGTVAYRLEAVANNPGFTFNLPPATTATFTTADTRTFTLSYDLEFTNSVSGEMWLHVTAPNDLESSRVPFSLTCQATPAAP